MSVTTSAEGFVTYGPEWFGGGTILRRLPPGLRSDPSSPATKVRDGDTNTDRVDIAADAMPYHRRRRLVCNRRWSAPEQPSNPPQGAFCPSGAAPPTGTGSTGTPWRHGQSSSKKGRPTITRDHSQRGSSAPRRSPDGHRSSHQLDRACRLAMVAGADYKRSGCAPSDGLPA